LNNDLARKLGRRLRRVTEALGTVRELDVLFTLLDELHESGRFHEGGLSRVSTAVAHDRDEARKRQESRMPVAELRRLGSKLDVVAGELKELKKQEATRLPGAGPLALAWRGAASGWRRPCATRARCT
jgi:CHAD domain-containing protein